jgi:predicted P-loop ATPase/5S rRNA maturation endonuclease (ribonuclease M5)
VVDVGRTKSLGRLQGLAGADTKLAKSGDRWVGLCPFHKEKTPSFGVFSGKDGHERYHCFGCGASGDVLDYVMETRRVDFATAASIISGDDGDTGAKRKARAATPPHDPYKDVTPIIPIPKGTKKIKPGERIAVWNPKRERWTKYKPTAAHLYKVAGKGFGYVLRMDMDDGRKITPQIMWCSRPGKADDWSHYTFPKPRPLYGVDLVKSRKQVVVVEGEKAADAGKALLKMAVVTWVGGTGAVEHSDWSALAGKDIIIVPDADEPGRAAATEIAGIVSAAKAKKVRIVDTSGQPKGWDLADIKDWTRDQTIGWLKERAQPWEPPPPPPAKVEGDSPEEYADWQEGVIYNADGGPKATSSHNYITFLMHHPDLAGIFVLNEFSLQITLTKCPKWDKPDTFKPRDIADDDITFCQAQLEHYGLSPKYDSTRKAIMAAASKRAIHPARTFFMELKDKWDGTKRLDQWLTYYLGVAPTKFSSIVGRKWLIAAVRRVFQPGCKFDTMLILEGPQNIGKSLALRELATFGGVSYFTDAIGDIQRKEAAMTMHGVLIVELAELDALSKAEITQIKSWVTRQEDQYRPPYGSTIRKAPRQCVLAGTVNPEGGYLKDSTGNRRFWPVWCTAVDLEALAHDREQLWAEAVVAHLAGEPLYLRDEEIKVANRAQEERYQEDIWADDLDEYISLKREVSVRIITRDVLQIPAERRSMLQERRIVRHLTNRGWKRVKRRLGVASNKKTWVFISPEEQADPQEPGETVDGTAHQENFDV